jgi:type II secretion system protein G
MSWVWLGQGNFIPFSVEVKVTMKTKRSSGFTLVEVLIVVVIMAILAAAIIPQFSDSSNQAKMGTAEFNWHTLKSQVELYKSQHDGVLPDALSKLTVKTNSKGTTSASDGALVFGPYISELPANPWNNSKTEKAATSAPTAFSDVDGWYYNSATGELWLAGKEGGNFKLVGDN